jgi:simple sugar transport system permease protein
MPAEAMPPIGPRSPAAGRRWWQRLGASERWAAGLPTLAAIGLALLIGALIIVALGENPLRAYAALARGALGSLHGAARTLRMASPMILTGLAVIVAFRAGVINLGVEGSLYLGALAAALTGIYLPLPGWLHWLTALAVGAGVGALWALIPGLLRAWLNVNEVVATLMLNYVAVLLADYLVLNFFLDPAIGKTSDRPATVPIPETARLPVVLPQFNLTAGIVIGLLLTALVVWLFRRSVWGYEVDLTGLNRRFAHYGGVRTQRVMLGAMAVSGLLGGLAGATESLGEFGRYVAGFSNGLGFDGVTVALMGGLNPLGALAGAIFLGALKNGAAAMELAVNVPRDMVLVVQGLILALLTAKHLLPRPRRRARGAAEAEA